MNSVLVIDDSLMVRRQVGGALRDVGYAVIEAVDGQDAVDQLEAGAQPKMVICDVNMPRMNGIEFLERLAARGGAIPVVMLTTEGDPEMIRRAKALGAKGWLIKPFKQEHLMAIAKKLVPLA
jgi:two-component system, chemotaxis family, chemotaxis protein CheY